MDVALRDPRSRDRPRRRPRPRRPRLARSRRACRRGPARRRAPRQLARHLPRARAAPTASARAGQPVDLAAFLPRPSDDHRVALREWVFALTLDRVLWADSARLASARRAAAIIIDRADLGHLEISPRDLLHRVLAEPDPRRRRLLAEVLEQGAFAAQDAARIYEERRLRPRGAAGRSRSARGPARSHGDRGRPRDHPPRRARVPRRGHAAADRAARAPRRPLVGRGRRRGCRPRAGRGLAGAARRALDRRVFHATPLTEGCASISARSRARSAPRRSRARSARSAPRSPTPTGRAGSPSRWPARPSISARAPLRPLRLARRRSGLRSPHARPRPRRRARSGPRRRAHLGLAVRLAATRAMFRGLLALPESARAVRFRRGHRRGARRADPACARGRRPAALARGRDHLPRLPPRRARSPRPGRALRRGLVPEPQRGPRHPRRRRGASCLPPRAAALVTAGLHELVRALTDLG